MPDTEVRLRLNQQQRELLDRTVKEQESDSRSQLIARALDEFSSAHFERETEKQG